MEVSSARIFIVKTAISPRKARKSRNIDAVRVFASFHLSVKYLLTPLRGHLFFCSFGKQQHHRLRRDALAASAEPKLLGGGRLHVDGALLHTQVGGDMRHHLRDMRRHPRRLRDDGGVHVADAKTLLTHQMQHLTQQDAAVDVLVLRLGVGEMFADVAQRCRAQQRIARTEERAGLWQAQTPQMFRAGLLAQALGNAKNVTDEAAAVEALGLRPKLVLSTSSNFKVTYPQDLLLAELLLKEKM